MDLACEMNAMIIESKSKKLKTVEFASIIFIALVTTFSGAAQRIGQGSSLNQ